jgi:hypothetical protein
MMKNISWYPTYRHHHREGNERGSGKPHAEPRVPQFAQGDERERGSGGSYGDDGGERQEVRIQHGPHGSGRGLLFRLEEPPRRSSW